MGQEVLKDVGPPRYLVASSRRASGHFEHCMGTLLLTFLSDGVVLHQIHGNVVKCRPVPV